MLTEAALKALKPKEKTYKVVDRDGMYVRVMPSRAISFRLDLQAQRTAGDGLSGQVRTGRNLACLGP